MPRADVYKPEQRFFAAFIGKSGCGKSAAAASFNLAPNPEVLDMDFDYRFAGIAGYIKQGVIKSNGISYEQFSPRKGWGPVDTMLTNLEMHITTYQTTGKFPYGTIITDSLHSLTRLLIVSSHSDTKGKMIGKLRISGPADYGFEVSGTHQYFDFMRILPCNIICSAHTMDRYGKPPGANEFAQNEVVGEKLTVRDQLGETILTYFNDVWKFSRELQGQNLKYYVEFTTDLAKNSFGIPVGKYDITNKAFYPFLQELIAKYDKRETK